MANRLQLCSRVSVRSHGCRIATAGSLVQTAGLWSHGLDEGSNGDDYPVEKSK